MSLEHAFDELTAYNDLLDWCKDFESNQMIEELAIALSGELVTIPKAVETVCDCISIRVNWDYIDRCLEV
jgi:hypothetical protein